MVPGPPPEGDPQEAAQDGGEPQEITGSGGIVLPAPEPDEEQQ